MEHVKRNATLPQEQFIFLFLQSLAEIHLQLDVDHGAVVRVAEVEGAVPEGALLRLVVVVHVPVEVPLQIEKKMSCYELT